MKTYMKTLTMLGSVAMFSIAAFAQVNTSPYSVQFFRAAQALNGDVESVDIVDPAPSNLCANIYVVTPDEELQECCSCKLTPDQLIEIPIYDLTQNAANGTTVNNGAIKLISSTVPSSGACNAGTVTPASVLAAWKVIGAQVGIEVSDNQFLPATLSTAEENSLVSTCSGIQQYDSGAGICKCPPTLPNVWKLGNTSKRGHARTPSRGHSSPAFFLFDCRSRASRALTAL